MARAEDDQYLHYAEDAAETQGRTLLDVLGDEDFQRLWANRHDSNTDMAALLMYCLGIDYDTAMYWILYPED